MLHFGNKLHRTKIPFSQLFTLHFYKYFSLAHSFYIVPNLVTSWQLATESSVNIHLFQFVYMMYNKSKNILYENLTRNTHICANVVHSKPQYVTEIQGFGRC
jgi:hypothetical protein